MSDRTRRALLADEIGAANVEYVAAAYREAWHDALNAARHALISAGGAPVPRGDDALRAWLSEPVHRLHVGLRAKEIVHTVETAEAITDVRDLPWCPEES